VQNKHCVIRSSWRKELYKYITGEPFSKNIFCASDVPYGRQTWNFGGIRLMFESLKNGKDHTDKRLQQNPDLFDDNVIQNYLGKILQNL